MLQYAILADIEGGLSEFLVFGFIYGRYVDENACVCTAVLTLLVNVHSRFSSFELVWVIRPQDASSSMLLRGLWGTRQAWRQLLLHIRFGGSSLPTSCRFFHIFLLFWSFFCLAFSFWSSHCWKISCGDL